MVARLAYSFDPAEPPGQYGLTAPVTTSRSWCSAARSERTAQQPPTLHTVALTHAIR